MKHSKIERKLRPAEVVHVQALSRKPKGFLPEDLEGIPIERVEAMPAPYLPAPPPKPAGKATETARAEALPPYVVEIEVSCDDCGGSGCDPGGLDPWGPEPCPVCHGAKTQWSTRNYLAEAFQIVANPESTRSVERAHLVAIVQYCRQTVSAVVSLPEVA